MRDIDFPINLFPNACPCCGYDTLDQRGDWDICPVCWWEDDGQDNYNANKVLGGPNKKISLTRARMNFITVGISCPARTDLREMQKSALSYDRQRKFEYDLSSQTVSETELNWQTTVSELDDNPRSSRFKSGEHVLYRRRDRDISTRVGRIETVEWYSTLEYWHYRLIDETSKPIAKWFSGSSLVPCSEDNLDR